MQGQVWGLKMNHDKAVKIKLWPVKLFSNIKYPRTYIHTVCVLYFRLPDQIKFPYTDYNNPKFGF